MARRLDVPPRSEDREDWFFQQAGLALGMPSRDSARAFLSKVLRATYAAGKASVGAPAVPVPTVTVERMSDRDFWRVWLHVGGASFAVGDGRGRKEAAETMADALRYALGVPTTEQPEAGTSVERGGAATTTPPGSTPGRAPSEPDPLDLWRAAGERLATERELFAAWEIGRLPKGDDRERSAVRWHRLVGHFPPVPFAVLKATGEEVDVEEAWIAWKARSDLAAGCASSRPKAPPPLVRPCMGPCCEATSRRPSDPPPPPPTPTTTELRGG